jgi:lauroyl/myristoyl acyltransferase
MIESPVLTERHGGTLPVPAAPRPYLRGCNIDCDATPQGTFRPAVPVKLSDIADVVRLFTWQGAVAWLLPPRLWPAVAGAVARASVALYGDRTANNLKLIGGLMAGREGPPSPLEIERGFFAGRIEERFGYLRSHRPGGWNPVIRIHGAEHVRTAQAAGKGIVFWGGHFAFNDLLSKIAFQRLGLEVYHYTRPVHGLSDSRFGVRFLNPIRTVIERRYLGARVAGEEKIPEAMEVLREVVAAGGAASIKTGNRGKRLVAVPFLGGRLQMATGPVFLARRWGAVLLPTFTLRAADASFDVIIGAPLDSNESDMEAHCGEVVRGYAEQLKPHFLADPTQWRGWRLILDKEADAKTLRHRTK